MGRMVIQSQVFTSVKIPVFLLNNLLEHRNRFAYNPKAVHYAVQDLEAHLLGQFLDLCMWSSLGVSVIF